MSVLILSCSTGQGHNSVAEAIREALEAQGEACEIVDALRFISERTARFMSWGHSFVYCHIPRLFTAGYGAAERHTHALEEGSAAYRFFARGAEELYNYCASGGYETILCTHVFSALMYTEAKKKGFLPASSYFVATDYTCSPGTLDSDLDGYFIPDRIVAPQFRPKILYPVGIPIRRSFFSTFSQQDAKHMLGIPADHSHILMMCGSMGCGPIEEIVELLMTQMPSHCELTVVCGKNQRLKEQLDAAAGQDGRIHIRGYVDNVPLLMDASDLYITKPGGISTTEAMAKGLPMVLVDAVAGCEEHNMRFFTELGGAVAAKKAEEITALCLMLLNEPEHRRRMSDALLSRGKNAAQRIAEHICRERTAALYDTEKARR